MRYQDLFESTRMPNHQASVKAALQELESQLWDNDLATYPILEILNDAMGIYLIRFDEVNDHGQESNYSRVGIDGASLSDSGWISVNIMSSIDAVMNDGRVYYSEFVDLCHAVITHELAHREQVLKSVRNFDASTDPSDMKRYLSDHREIDAYAIQASLELLAVFGPQLDILEKLRTGQGIEHLSLHSDALKNYSYVFELSDKPFRKFLKKLIDVLTARDD